MLNLIFLLIFSNLFQTRALCIDKASSSTRQMFCESIFGNCECGFNEICECKCVQNNLTPPMLCNNGIIGCLLETTKIISKNEQPKGIK